MEDALFLLCPWFSHEVFYTVMSFNEASEDTGFTVFSSAADCCYSPGSEIHSPLPSSFLCIFRTRGSVKCWTSGDDGLGGYSEPTVSEDIRSWRPTSEYGHPSSGAPEILVYIEPTVAAMFLYRINHLHLYLSNIFQHLAPVFLRSIVSVEIESRSRRM